MNKTIDASKRVFSYFNTFFFHIFENLFTMPETLFTLVNRLNLHLLPSKGHFKKQSC